MRFLLFAIMGIAASSSLLADGPAFDPNAAYTLISVSSPGWSICETNSLCLLSPPGKGTPLRLKIVQGIADPKCFSLESEADPGYFLRHQDSQLKLHPYAENDGVFARDSTFYIIRNPNGSVSFRSYNYPKQYITVTASKEVYISTDPEVPFRSFFLR